MKKFFFSVMLAVFTGIVTVSAGENPGFDSRRAIAEYAFNAFVNRDAKAMVNTFAPKTIEEGIKIFGSRKNLEIACQEYLNLAPDSYLKQMRRTRKQTIRNLANDRDLIQINGKWYSSQNFDEISFSYTMVRFLDAVLSRDTDTLWTLLTPETQNRMNKDADNDPQLLKKNLTDLCKGFIGDDHIANIKANRQAFIAQQVAAMYRSRIMVNIDGKFFLNLIELMGKN